MTMLTSKPPHMSAPTMPVDGRPHLPRVARLANALTRPRPHATALLDDTA
jgi:hypothetical protein